MKTPAVRQSRKLKRGGRPKLSLEQVFICLGVHKVRNKSSEAVDNNNILGILTEV